MNLQEHIRKVLKEERTESIVKIIGEYIKTFYPNFNKDDVDTHEMIDGRGFIVTMFFESGENGMWFGKYREGEKELQLSTTLFNELEGTFGDDMEYVIDWFNNEFSEDAEYVTY